MTEPDFWNDNLAAQKTSQELNELKTTYNNFHLMIDLLEESEILRDFLAEDESVREELVDKLTELDKLMTSYEMTLLLSEPYDHNNAILEIHPGSGGTEAQDWGEMLMRMYMRYGNAMGYKVETLDYQAGDRRVSSLLPFPSKVPMPMVFSSPKWGFTAWFGFHPLTRPNAAILPLPLSR